LGVGPIGGNLLVTGHGIHPSADVRFIGIVGLNVSQPMTDGCYRNTPGIVQDEAEVRAKV
jgi:hypothetical protein